MNSRRPPAHDRAAFLGRLREITNGPRGVEELAKKSGVSMTALKNALGRGEPGRPALCALAKGAGVNVAWLVAGEGVKTGPVHPRDLDETIPGWVTVNEFKRCIVEDGRLWAEHGEPIVKVSPKLGSRAFPNLKDPKRLACFSVEDSYMDPDLIENEYVVCEIPEEPIPKQLNGILGVVLKGQILGRYVSMVSPTEVMISHRKTSVIDAMRVHISEIGQSVFILGKIMLAGSYVGNRHRDWVSRLQDADASLIAILDYEAGCAAMVEQGLSDLGIAATNDERRRKITAFVSQTALTKLPMIPGVGAIDSFPMPAVRKSAA